MSVKIERGATPGNERAQMLDPEGSFVARSADGGVVGAVSCVVWDAVASIGGLAGPDDETITALFSAATEHARSRGAARLVADVAPATIPLVERAGLTRAGESARWTRTNDPPPPSRESGAFAIYPVSSAEIMELVAYDKPRFGAGRGRYLATLMAEEPHRAFVAVDRRDGVFSGLAMVDGAAVGPVVADTAEAAAWLLHALASARAPRDAIVPGWNDHARDAFTAAGYAPTSDVRVRMMSGGTPPPGHPAIVALGRWGLG